MTQIQQALIHVIVTASASDGNMSDNELRRMTAMVENLPIFDGFDASAVRAASDACTQMLGDDDGLDRIIAGVKATLPERLRETAYAVACDVAAADGSTAFEELAFLSLLRDELAVDRLTAAAIERGARARLARA